MEDKIFDIESEPRPRGSWWWWFWLFFFDNPKDPSRPRQLMILWSTKNDRQIDCNDLKIRLNHTGDRKRLDGAVASWYFDGERMHHNFLLEPCIINVGPKGLSTYGPTPTSFAMKGQKSVIKIGDRLEFSTEPENHHDFAKPTFRSNSYFGGRGYSIWRLNHMRVSGMIDGAEVAGSAYFQRVFVNAPSPSWYWGIFHFEHGGILTYFNPHLFGKSFKKDVSFFDGSRMHKFADIDVAVKGNGSGLPRFVISCENEAEKLGFSVDPYSHSSWTFRKRFLGIFPNKLVYNEYPAVISDLRLDEKSTGKSIVLKDLGVSVGNAEHTTGLLF